jgi:hypothetical protein
MAILLFSQPLHAQKKYALLVGINEYYDAPGKLYLHSLQGCVNDAVSMRELLLNRFGFEKNNITTLFNGAATKRNLLEKFRSILQQCKPGDAFVFYYSGHGVWMNNDHNRGDRIKKGMSQAIVMSDLYSEGWSCLVRDETLKGMMNKFLDKKVIATTIMDCCFSANLLMSTRFDLFFMNDDERGAPKDFDIRYLPYFTRETAPSPCKGDSTDYVDSDNDHVYDCLDWEPNSPPGAVNERGVAVEIDAEKFYDARDGLVDSFGLSSDEKAFDINKTVKDTVISVQARPVDREGGGFVSMAATTDYEKGLEIIDLSGRRHGAFTSAMVHFFNNNSADASLRQIELGIYSLMDKQQYRQGPTFYADGSRENNNLIGLKTGNESGRLKATCLSIKNSELILNKGKNAGIFVGNRFNLINPGSKAQVRVTEVLGDSAKAVIVSGQIKAKDVLEMTDGAVITSPRLKVYIPSVPFTMEGYDQFIKKTITPEIKNPYYVGPTTDDYIRRIKFYLSATKAKVVSPYALEASDKFMVFLPFPSYIAEGLKARLAKDQNIELVRDTASADMMLFISMDPGSKEEKPNLKICFNSARMMQDNFLGTFFQPIYTTTNDLNLKGAALNKFYSDMESLVWRYLRKKTTAWLNQYPRRSN